MRPAPGYPAGIPQVTVFTDRSGYLLYGALTCGEAFLGVLTVGLSHACPTGYASAFLRDDHGVDVDVDDFGRLWALAWGNCRPIGHELRGCLAQRWVRFHSLPGSQRYAESEEQYTEILLRHSTILADLLPGDGEPGDMDLQVVTVSWSTEQQRTARDAEVAAQTPGARFWTSILTDDSDPGFPIWTHLWVSVSRLSDPHLQAAALPGG
jgi:hypothetical protein